MVVTTNPLGECSGYSKLLKIFNKKQNINWNEWLKLDKIFGKQGKQGVVGIFQSRDCKDLKCVFKVSKDIDYLPEHEDQVMQGLNELSSFCHNFSKPYGILDFKRNTEVGKNTNPFSNSDNVKYMIPDKMLVQEYINDSYKFSSYIKSKKINEKILYSTIKQVLMFITIVQKYKKFSHYDLHSDNIMMKKCNKNIVFVYVIDEGNQFCIPSHGHYPVVIDFGFSFIENMNDGPLWPSMAHTSAGFTSFQFDRIVDPKLFLMTVSDEMKEHRKTKETKKFRKIVVNIFDKLTIDDQSGWDEITETDASDYIYNIIEDYSDNSFIFDRYASLCIDIIQSLIILPMEKQTHVKVKQVYKMFITEWVKIENQITNPLYNLYILRSIVNEARSVRAAYLDDNTTNHAIEQFKTKTQECIDNVSKFCITKNINFEKMLCSLYVFATNMEDIYFTSIKQLNKTKEYEYKKLKFDTPEKMYAAIDSNIKSEYNYNKDTIMFVMDSIKKKTKIFKLTNDEIKTVNKTHSFCKGTVVYDIYKEKHM